jgi:hypothetical protein
VAGTTGAGVRLSQTQAARRERDQGEDQKEQKGTVEAKDIQAISSRWVEQSRSGHPLEAG